MRKCGSSNFRLMGAVLVRIVLNGCGFSNLLLTIFCKVYSCSRSHLERCLV
jgi:hypothetical protein